MKLAYTTTLVAQILWWSFPVVSESQVIYELGADIGPSMVSDTQTDETSLEGSTTDFSDNNFHGNIHLAAGVTAGGRIGVGLQKGPVAIEAAYGYVLQNFISLSDVDKRITFGVNWKPNKRDRLAFGLLVVTRTRPGLGPYEFFEDFFLSPTIGLLPVPKKGFTFFIRGGLTFGYVHDPAPNEKNWSFLGPNVDAGIILGVF